MNKSTFLIVLAFMLVKLGYSQSAELTGIKKVTVSSANSISTRYDTKGYYIFYKLEKADKGNENYKLEVFNDNLKSTHSVTVKKPKDSYLLEGKFNGTHFCFSFMNYKLKTIDYDVYDLEGKKTGSHSVKDIEKMYFQQIYMQLQSEDSYYSGGLMEVPNKGFVAAYAKNDKGLKMSFDFIDNAGKKKWTKNSGNPEKAFEAADLLFSDENNIFIIINSRKSIMSKDVKSELMFVKSESGKIVSKTDFSTKTNYFWPFGVDFDEVSNEYLVYGEYYGTKNGKVDLKLKEGLFIAGISPEGKVAEAKKISWDKDFRSKIKAGDKDKVEDGIGLFVHKIIRLKNGKYYVIAEQFNKTASAMGIAGAVLSKGNSGVSTSQITILNMLIMTLNSNFEVEDVEVIEKKKSSVLLPSGAGYVSENLLGLYVKTYGGFDYNYTSVNKSNDNFNVVYVNYDKSQKKSKEDSKYYAGIIGLDASSKIKSTKLNLKTQPTFFNVMRSKTGYVILYEYFKKEKKVTFRMEKLDL